MKRNSAIRNLWLWVLVILAAAILAPAGMLLLSREGAGASVEVVTAQPLLARQDTQAALPALAVSQPAGESNPRASVSSSFHNFGAVGASDVVRRDFLVINRGAAPLVIQQAYTTCGCTVAEISARVIPPGKAARARVIFDAGFHDSAGQTVRRGLIIETNDPEHPQIEIWVQASVEQ